MAKKGDIRTATATTSVSVLLGERNNRTCVILFPPSAGSYTVSDSPAITNGEGVFMTATSQAVVLDRATVGDLPAQALFVIASGTLSFGIIEVVE